MHALRVGRSGNLVRVSGFLGFKKSNYSSPKINSVRYGMDFSDYGS